MRRSVVIVAGGFAIHTGGAYWTGPGGRWSPVPEKAALFKTHRDAMVALRNLPVDETAERLAAAAAFRGAMSCIAGQGMLESMQGLLDQRSPITKEELREAAQILLSVVLPWSALQRGFADPVLNGFKDALSERIAPMSILDEALDFKVHVERGYQMVSQIRTPKEALLVLAAKVGIVPSWLMTRCAERFRAYGFISCHLDGHAGLVWRQGLEEAVQRISKDAKDAQSRLLHLAETLAV